MTDNNVTELLSPELKKALKARDEFLKKNPEYIKLQDKIEIELKKAGNQNNRMSAIAGLLMDSQKQLHKEINQLHELLLELNEIAKDKK